MNLEKIIGASYNKIDDIGSKIVKYYPQYAIAKDHKNNTINIINEKDKSLLIKSDYIFVGSYDPNSKIWLWSHTNFTLSGRSKEYKKIINKFDKKLTDDIIKYDDTKYVEKIHNYLSNDMFHINHTNIFDLVRTIIHILGGNGVITDENTMSGMNKIDFYVIQNIIVNNIKISKDQKDK